VSETTHAPGQRLAGKVALVTGASRNIGRAVAVLFAAEGASLALGTQANAAALAETARRCRAVGADVLELQGDVADRAVCTRLVDEATARYGRVDVLVNTVAFRPRTPFLQVTPAEWQRVLDVNLGATFHLCQLVVPGMIERRTGSIVTYGGLHAMTGGTAGPNSAAKMGLLGLVRALAIDLGPHNVRVNMIVPGRIGGEGREVGSVEDIPMQRYGTGDEIARATLFLASEDAAYVTGERIMVTGGRANL
jgi:3-oxoacyl-[acyl-carrier protein] reductase